MRSASTASATAISTVAGSPTWRMLDHPHTVPFAGVVADLGRGLCRCVRQLRPTAVNVRRPAAGTRSVTPRPPHAVLRNSGRQSGSVIDCDQRTISSVRANHDPRIHPRFLLVLCRQWSRSAGHGDTRETPSVDQVRSPRWVTTAGRVPRRRADRHLPLQEPAAQRGRSRARRRVRPRSASGPRRSPRRPATPRWPSEDEVLDSCDAVYICTWTSEHLRQVAKAAAARAGRSSARSRWPSTSRPPRRWRRWSPTPASSTRSGSCCAARRRTCGPST